MKARRIKTMKGKNMLLRIGIMFSVIMAPVLMASELDKKTIINLPEAMEIPGQVLPAGEYVIKRADESLPNVIQFSNAEETEVLATVHTIPTQRPKPSDKAEIVVEERPAGSPEAIKKWFYPGELTGAEFVYPGETLVAQATAPSEFETRSSDAPASPAAEEEAPAGPSSKAQEPLEKPVEEPIAERQAEEPVVMAQARPEPAPEPGATQTRPSASGQPATSGQSQLQDPAQQQLPRTATGLPLASLLGGLAIFGGVMLRRFSGRRG
jgi:hypothetical protein